MSIAYLVLAHDRPAQLARLVRALPSHSPIFIHYDRRSADFAEAVRAVANVRSDAAFVPRHACRWGAPGILYATLELIDALVSSGHPFRFATLLSGSDYPIQSNDLIERELSDDQEYIECFPLLEPNRWTDHGGHFHAAARVFGRYLRFRSHVWRIGSRKMPEGVIPFGGSQWWSLSAGAVRYVHRVAHGDSNLIRFLAGSFIPDECFIQTILGNSPFRSSMTQDDLRLAIWDRPEPPFPAVLGLDDLPLLAASGKHFARKFDFERCPDIANKLDKMRKDKGMEMAKQA